jgi:predicted nuclease with TOPRIM domain
MVLIGIRMRYTHLQRMRQHQVGGEDLGQVAEDVSNLREDVRQLREEYAELYERVEFAERMLTKGQAGAPLAPPSAPEEAPSDPP